MEDIIQRMRSTADYQFGKGVGVQLFPDNVKIVFSRNTGRVRYIYLDDERLATLRPTDGLFSLSIKGAKRIAKALSVKRLVTVGGLYSEFIADGGDVFSAHVVRVDDEVRPKDEVIVLNERKEVLAVGRAVLSAEEMRAFKRGVAVKVRHGAADES